MRNRTPNRLRGAQAKKHGVTSDIRTFRWRNVRMSDVTPCFRTKKSPLRERAESIFLEENRGDRRMMLHCRNIFQFIFVMSVITIIDEARLCWRGNFVMIGQGGEAMATVVRHRKVNIVVLEADEPIAAWCKPGDIAIVAAPEGWWTNFIG